MSLYHQDNIIHRVVNSADRLSGSVSNFTINLNLPTIASTFDKICCISCSIPKSWYDIPESITGFTLTEDTVTVNCNIPAGFYSSSTLRSAVETVLNQNSPFSNTYTVTYSSVTNRFTFVCSDTTTPLMLGFPLNNSLYSQLGFNNDYLESFTDGVLTSSNSISIPHINRLFIKSDCCGTVLDNLLQELYVTSVYPSRSFIYWENTGMIDVYSKPFSISNNNVYNFIITDSRGQEIDFQGQELNFSLIFFKKNNTDQAVLENIKADNLEKILA